jgi:hypothetical protein
MKTINSFNRVFKSTDRGVPTCLESFGLPAFKITVCLIFIVLLDSCMPCYYAPNAQNVPLFTEKKQANGTFGFQLGTLSGGLNIQGALSVSDHIGLMANYNHFAGKAEAGIFIADYSHNFSGNIGEFGLGYFMPFKSKCVFETYAGLGTSKITTDYQRSDGDGTSTLNTNSYFIQPAIGYYRKKVKLAFSSRFRLLDFKKVQYDPWLGNSAKEFLIDLQNNPNPCLFEPAFTVRVGGEHVKFQAQIGLSVLIGHSKINDYDPLNINIGVVFSLHGKKKSAVNSGPINTKMTT